MRLCDWVGESRLSKRASDYVDRKLNLSLLYDIASRKANVLLGCINRYGVQVLGVDSPSLHWTALSKVLHAMLR